MIVHNQQFMTALIFRGQVRKNVIFCNVSSDFFHIFAGDKVLFLEQNKVF